MKHVLLVDEGHRTRASLEAMFEGQYRLSTAGCHAEASEFLAQHTIDLILLDVSMPGSNGIEFLEEAHRQYPDIPIVMVSGSASVRPAVEAIRRGAYDYVTQPFEMAEIRRVVDRALESRSLQQQVTILRHQIAEEFPIDDMVGASPLFRDALNAARDAAATCANVLISGEGGTGKELMARFLHTHSARASEPFVPVHCGELPESLMEGELFGHEPGTLTHAVGQNVGRFDLAGSGTIYFDEIVELTPSTQVKLLRVLQEKEFIRVGGTRVIHTDARIVAATNMDLKKAVAENTFEEALYDRLCVVPIHLPPLRERTADIPGLAEYFLRRLNPRSRYAADSFSEEAIQRLQQYPWPGNVRELRNVVERMLVLFGQHNTILADHLPREFQPTHPEVPLVAVREDLTLSEAVGNFERQLVENALREANGVQTRAAEILGTTRRILKYRMEKLNIQR